MEIFVSQNDLGFHEFHLQNEHISYIVGVLKNGHLGSYYFGKRLRQRNNFYQLVQQSEHELGVSPSPLIGESGFSLDCIPREYPSYGQGDYREPAIEILQPNGSTFVDFKFTTYEIVAGKAKLEGLPATYVEHADEAKTLRILHKDAIIDCELVLSYTIFRDHPAITRNVHLINHSDSNYFIRKLMSMSIDFPQCYEGYSVMHLSGAWSRERSVVESPLTQSKYVIGSTRGLSSANHQPFLGIKKGLVTENLGEIFGFSFVYSGNFQATAEINHYGQLRAIMGIHPDGFEWKLKPNSSFQSPEVVIVYSDKGVGSMSRSFQKLYQNNLARGHFKNKVRPIKINNWEATYFDFDEDRILSIARKAKNLGIELFVLDDGWFGTRNDDTQGLGDWEVNTDKLPSGISGLAQKINDFGMQFGLWFEPEMVNKNSDLYRKYPDWILHIPERSLTPSRKQFVLDLTRKEVQDFVYYSVAKHLSKSKISYVKWDMNRPMTEVMSAALPHDQQGEVFHRYYLGLYAVLEKLNTDFPRVLFEFCASGGNRFDAGMLHYMPQGWTSDNTDPIARISIQRGTSLIYPLSVLGAHVSASPNHQTGRLTDLKTRTAVAYFGVFGYELDPNQLTLNEQDQIRQDIQFYIENRNLLQFGNFYRLRYFQDGEKESWMVVNEDKTEAIIGDFLRLSSANDGFNRLKLEGLNANEKYTVVGDHSVVNSVAYGDEWMQSGLIFKSEFFSTSPLTEQVGDSKSRIIKIEML